MKFSKKVKRKNISDNLLNPDFVKAKEEIIARLMSRFVIMPFGPFKMTFISPESESGKINKEKENVDKVRETKSGEEVQEKIPPKKTPLQKKII